MFGEERHPLRPSGIGPFGKIRDLGRLRTIRRRRRRRRSRRRRRRRRRKNMQEKKTKKKRKKEQRRKDVMRMKRAKKERRKLKMEMNKSTERRKKKRKKGGWRGGKDQEETEIAPISPGLVCVEDGVTFQTTFVALIEPDDAGRGMGADSSIGVIRGRRRRVLNGVVNRALVQIAPNQEILGRKPEGGG